MIFSGFKLAKLIHFLTKFFHTQNQPTVVYSDPDFNKCVEMESVHLVVFLLLCLDNQKQSFSSSKLSLKQQKENKHTRQKHKKVKWKYMIQGVPGFLLEESLFIVTSLTIASHHWFAGAEDALRQSSSSSSSSA